MSGRAGRAVRRPLLAALCGTALATGAVAGTVRPPAPPPTPGPSSPTTASAGAAPPEESLAAAIADAYRNNPQLEGQRAGLRALDETLIQASSPYRLTVSLNAELDYQQQRVRNVAGAFQPVEDRSMGATLSAQQILLNGGRTAAQVSAAEADILAGREGLRQGENSILLEVVDAYVAVRRDAAIIAIQERSVESYERQVTQARAREREGDLTRTDIAQAQAQLLIIRASLSQARANLQQSRARFATVVGRAPGTLAPEPPLPGIPASVEQAYRVAEAESPQLWQAILNERAARSRVAGARAEQAPTLVARGSFGYVDPVGYRSRDMGQAVTGGLTLSVPLVNAGVVNSRIRAATAQVEQSGFAIESTRRATDQAVLNYWNQAISAREQAVIGREAATAAEDALRGVRRGFEEGFRSNFELLDSELRLLNAQLIVANAGYAQYVAQAALLSVLGRLQAAAITTVPSGYRPERNLARRRTELSGPFQVVLEPLDKVQRPSGATAPPPRLDPPAVAPVMRAATAPPPEGALGTRYPIDGVAPRR